MIEPQLTGFKSTRATIGIKDMLQDNEFLFVLLYGAYETYDIYFSLLSVFSMFIFNSVWQNNRAKSKEKKKTTNNYIKSALPDKDGMTAQTELLAVRQCHHTLAQNAR